MKKPDKRRHRARRILLRVGGVVALLAFVVAIVVQIVLWSDYPRRLVLSLVQKEMGLRVDAKSLSTSWLGNTTLRDVTVSLPLGKEPFLTTPELRVSHTNLLILALTGSLELEKVVVERPKLMVRQAESGQWNLVEAAGVVDRATQKPAQEEKSSGPPTIPALVIEDGVISVIDQQGRHQTIEGVNVTGAPGGKLVYRFDIEALPQVQLHGEVAVGGNWKHTAKFDVKKLGAWVRPWIQDWPGNAAASGEWSGQLGKEGALAGRVDQLRLTVKKYEVKGSAKIGEQGGNVTLEPAPLVVQTGQDAATKIIVHGGRVAVDATGIEVKGLRLGAAGGNVLVDGHYGMAEGVGAIDALWRDLSLPGEIRTGGQLTAKVTKGWPGGPGVTGSLMTTGKTAYGTWNTTMAIDARGPAWSEMNWTLRAPTLAFEPNEKAPAGAVSADRVGEDRVDAAQARAHADSYRASDLVIHLSTHGKTISLDDMSVATGGDLAKGARVAGQGVYDLTNGKWWLYLDSAGWRVGKLGTTLGASLDAWGNRDYVTLNQAYVHSGAMELVAKGYYGFAWANPAYVHVYVNHPPGGKAPREDAPLHGRLVSNAYLSGTVSPMKLSLQGDLKGREIALLGHPVGDVSGELAGVVDEGGVKLGTQVKLNDGVWTLKASFPEYNRRMNAKVLRAWASVKGGSLANLGKSLGREDLAGTVDGDWTIDVAGFAPGEISMSGELAGRDMRVGAMTAKTASAKSYIQDGQLRIDPVVLRQGDHEGRINASVALELAHPRTVGIAAAAAGWRADVPALEANVLVDGATRGPLRLDLLQGTVEGSAEVSAKIAVRGKEAGDAVFSITLRPTAGLREVKAGGGMGAMQGGAVVGQRIGLTKLDAKVLGGTVKGNAAILMDSLAEAGDVWGWTRIHANVKWDDLHAARLAELLPAHPLHDLGGTYSGQLIVEHTDDPRALEPQRLRMQLNSDGGHFRSMRIGAASIFAYIGQRRFVMSSDPDERSVIHLAGGQVEPWMRISRPARDYQTLMQFALKDLDLDQIIHMFDPERKPTPGLVSGSATVFGDLDQTDRLNGSASIKVTHSDLLHMPALSLLYNLMSAGSGGLSKEPSGSGSLEARLEEGNLQLANLRYFNRGIDAHGNIVFGDVMAWPQTTLKGAVVGTARPFKDLKLPLLADADQIFSVLQSTLTTVGIGGTAAKPNIYQSSLSEIGQAFRDLLIGDAKKQ